MKIIAITQARSGSSRLPNKVLMNVGAKKILELHIERITKSKRIHHLIVATTIAAADEEIVKLVSDMGIKSFRGSEEDVLDRFYQSTIDEIPDYVVRLTSDCPLLDAELMDKIIDFTLINDLDYCSNTLDPSYPDGQDIEVFRFSALVDAWKNATLKSDREHVTPYIWRNSIYKGGTLFKSANFSEGYNYEKVRITIDELPDYDLIVKVVEAMGTEASWLEYTNFILENPDLLSMNEAIKRNEGFIRSLKKRQSNNG